MRALGVGERLPSGGQLSLGEGEAERSACGGVQRALPLGLEERGQFVQTQAPVVSTPNRGELKACSLGLHRNDEAFFVGVDAVDARPGDALRLFPEQDQLRARTGQRPAFLVGQPAQRTAHHKKPPQSGEAGETDGGIGNTAKVELPEHRPCDNDGHRGAETQACHRPFPGTVVAQDEDLPFGFRRHRYWSTSFKKKFSFVLLRRVTVFSSTAMMRVMSPAEGTEESPLG